MRPVVAVVVIALAACGDNFPAPDTFCDAWHQWGGDPGHHGATCSAGQPLSRVLADVVIDPFMVQEEHDAFGDLVIHYQAPLLDHDAVYMMTKHGTYTPCDTVEGLPYPNCYVADGFHDDELYRLNSQIWSETRYAWHDGVLATQWSFESDWKPVPGNYFEPMFQPALIGTTIAIPGAAGSVWIVDGATGDSIRHVTPFGTDRDTYVAGGIAVDDGTIYYNAIKVDHGKPDDLSQSWLVAVAADGTTRAADYATLVPGAPAPDDLCYGTYVPRIDPMPWPLPAGVDGTPTLPKQHACGVQRPGLNTLPAFSAGGTIFVVTGAQHAENYSYIVALDHDLTPKWATSLRGLLNDGCGETVAYANTDSMNESLCRDGAPVGIDPTTGMQPAAAVISASSSSPVALPDGGVLYGAFTGYNGFRGHLIKLTEYGHFAGSYDFGWDSTPSVVETGASYHIVIKDNHYGEDELGVDLGPYFITELDASMNVIWKFQSTETQSCTRQADGTLDCTADHPHGFEWCINAPVVDRDGVTYVNSEDGNLYAITADGVQRDKLFLEQSVGAAYTPLALDSAGRVYSLNNGHLVVVGQ